MSANEGVTKAIAKMNLLVPNNQTGGSFYLIVPWIPEDIFFLSILMVRGEAALTRRKAPRRKKKKISSGTQGNLIVIYF